MKTEKYFYPGGRLQNFWNNQEKSTEVNISMEA